MSLLLLTVFPLSSLSLQLAGLPLILFFSSMKLCWSALQEVGQLTRPCKSWRVCVSEHLWVITGQGSFITASWGCCYRLKPLPAPSWDWCWVSSRKLSFVSLNSISNLTKQKTVFSELHLGLKVNWIVLAVTQTWSIRRRELQRSHSLLFVPPDVSHCQFSLQNYVTTTPRGSVKACGQLAEACRNF